jgi:hypothetical protein
MPLSNQTLTAIQSAGAAVFAADAALKESVQVYANQVRSAMASNPFDMGNDSLFESWKTVARLSQAMQQIESELQKLYGLAVEVSSETARPSNARPSLAAPTDLSVRDVELINPISATDVLAKKPRGQLKGKGVKRKTRRATPLGGNTGKLYAYLQPRLNPLSFVKFNQSAIATDIGLPKGSIGASVLKLLKAGLIVQGARSEFKLGAAR